MKSAPFPRCVPLGDSAITIVLGEGISRELSGKVLESAAAVRSAVIGGVVEVVPAYASISVFYDPCVTRHDELLMQLRSVVEGGRPAEGFPAIGRQPVGRSLRIPVFYDGEDLADVAERTGHTTEEVISLHSAREYQVYVIGFVPGFAYLGELDPSLILPRRSSPRKRVPAGSVAVAEAQTGIYPFSTPGGWHLIGRTDAVMFDAGASEPALLRVGDRVVFESVGT